MNTRPAESIRVVEASLGHDVIEVYSTSSPEKIYRVDTVKHRCSCPAWIFQRTKRGSCKHLKAMGLV
jgi:predicted nucleic acid-binding Zn finger protein